MSFHHPIPTAQSPANTKDQRIAARTGPPHTRTTPSRTAGAASKAFPRSARRHPGFATPAAAAVASVLAAATLALGSGYTFANTLLNLQPTHPGTFRLTWSGLGGTAVLEQSDVLGPAAAWTRVPGTPDLVDGMPGLDLTADTARRFYRLVLTGSAPARVYETSPARGETDVSVHREVVFRFDRPLASDTVLDSGTVSARVAGQPLLTRVELATDRRSAALFFLEPVPPSARVLATLDGFRVLDAAGRALDADADGLPGGVAVVEYTTVHATPVGNTAVVGRVLASEKNPDGTDRPLPGVTITVDGAEQDLRAVTAADGSFTLQPAPAGRFFVHVDGRTSPLSQWPDGAYYPFVGKAWEAQAGRTNNLAGGNGLVHLPWVPGDALQPVQPSEVTRVTFSPSILAANPGLAGVTVDVPPNALFSDNGTRGGRVGIAPVAADRLPEPLPPGLNMPLVITIQTDGPSNFDRPVPVRFPNLPDPVTGEILPPGAKTALWSFDHDTGRWEIAGPMTISADGRFAVSDPGVGVRQPGWHGAAPGGPGGGPGGPGGGGGDPDCPTCDDEPPKEKPDCNFFNPFCEGNNCRKEARLLYNSVNDLISDIGAAHLDDGAPGCALGVGVSAMRAARDCSIDIAACGDLGILNPIIDGAAGAALGCAPKVGSILAAGWTFKSVIFNIAAVKECAGRQGQRAGMHGASIGAGAPFNDLVARLERLLERQLELCEASSNLVAVWFGPAWAVAQTPGDAAAFRTWMTRFTQAVQRESDGQRSVTQAERTQLLALPRPAAIDEAAIDDLIQRFQAMADGTFRASHPAAETFYTALDRLEAVIAARSADGWQTVWDGLFRVADILSAFAEPAAGSAQATAWTTGSSPGTEPGLQSPGAADQDLLVPAFPLRSHFFVLQDLASGLVLRGRLTPGAQWPPQILAPNRRYLATYLDPLTGHRGSTVFLSADSGSYSRIPAAPLLPDLGFDRDGDGLPDSAEWVLGSDPNRVDSDGDGVGDGAEFRSGSSVVETDETVLGVIGGVSVPGNARHLAVDEDLAIVADNTADATVFDLTDPRAPVRLSRIPVSRPRTVALSRGLAVIGHATGAVVADVRFPDSPLVITNFGGTAVQSAAIASPYAYLGRGNTVVPVSLATLSLLPATDAGAAVHDIAVDRDNLHVLTASELRIYQRSGPNLMHRSTSAVEGSISPQETGRRLFVGGGRAYVGHFNGFHILDVRDPDAPVRLATSTQGAAIHDLTDNGSGLLAAITSFSGTRTLAFSLYDIRTGTSATNFLTSLTTPGDPYVAVLHHGLAYVADGPGGLQVLNFLTPDRAGQAPTVSWGPPLLESPAVLEAGSYQVFTFATGDDVQVREVELFRDGERLGSSGSFPFQVPAFIAPPASGRTNAVFRARAIDTAGNERWTEERTVTLVPDQTPPEVFLIAPTSGSEAAPGRWSRLAVAFSEGMDPASFATGLVLTEAGPDGTLGNADDQELPSTWTYQPATQTAEWIANPGFASGRYRLTANVRLTDASGVPLATARAWTFRVLPPAVLATTPANNSDHRPGTPIPITARFNTLMDVASLRSGGFRLHHAGSDGQIGTGDDIPVDVASLTFSATSNRMVFSPSTPLRSGRYRAQLTTDAIDGIGNRLPQASTWSFDVLPPTVVAVNPPNGHARPLDGLSRIEIRFSEAMNPASLAAGISLSLTNGTAVTDGDVGFDDTTLTATLAFASPLPGGEYQLRVSDQAVDTLGNRVNPPFTSRFGVHGPVSWAVDADGRWDTAANWTPARPIPGDTVVLDRAAGDFTITHTTGHSILHSLRSAEKLRITGGSILLLSNSLSTGSLEIQGGTLSNRADLRITGPLTLGPRAKVRGGGTLLLAGPVNLQGSTLADSIAIGGQTLVVENGPLSWTTGSLIPDGIATNAHWIVQPGAALEAVAGTTARDWQGSRSTLWNRGIFRQTGTTNLLRWIGLTITNDGVWDITTGHAELQGGLHQTGRLSLSPGTSLQIRDDNGFVHLAPGATIEGQGSIGFRRTPATFAGRFAVTGSSTFESLDAAFTGTFETGTGPITFINANARFDNGPLHLAGPVTLREGTLEFRHPTTLDLFHWQFGDLHAAAPVTVVQPLRVGEPAIANSARLSGPGPVRFLGGFEQIRVLTLETNALLELAGTSVWRPAISAQSTGLTLDPGAILRITQPGILELATNRSVAGRGTIENLGTLIKSANTLTNIVSAVLENHGTLEVAGGALRLTAGGTLDGQVRILDGATLDVSGASERPGWDLVGAFTGTGILRLSGGSNHLSGTLQGPRLVVGFGSLRLPAESTLQNAEIRGGTVLFDTLLRLTGTNTFITGTETRLHGPGILRNEGRVTETTARIDATVENAGDWFAPASIASRYTTAFRNLPGASYSISNITSSSTGNLPIGTFDNAGMVRKLGTGNASLPFAFTNRGTLELTGNLAFLGSFTQTETGVTRLNGGILSPDGSPRLLLGEFHGPGTIGRRGTSGFYVITNIARLRPGGPDGFGTLHFNATAAYLRPDSIVHLRIGGSNPGVDHDQLRGSDSLWLGGRLVLEFVPGFTPSVGSTFRIVAANSRLQGFRSDIEVSGLPPGLGVRLNAASDGVDAEIIQQP